MSEFSMPLIHSLAEEGDFEGVVALVEQDRSLVHATLSESQPDQPLHLAVWQKNIDVAKFLIEHGADVNAPGDMGRTPLHYAALHGCLELAQVLLEHGADPNRKDNNIQYTPMLAGARSREEGGDKVANFLLESGAEADLNSLVSLGKTELVCQILANEENPLARAIDPQSLFDDAVIMVGIQAQQRGQHTFDEQEAVAKEYLPMFECLYKAGADINAVASTGFPALFNAALMNFPTLVRFLLEHGADVNYEYHNGPRVLGIMAMTQGRPQARQVVKEFKNKQATLD